jgi:D-alanyl-lipoteichoic acid acyltransferase DltB (MBOAT superfamily)
LLFNSYEFVFAFLPVAWLGFEALRRLRRERLAQWWLTFASLFFYGWWNPRFLPVLLVSMSTSYAIARRLVARPDDHSWRRKALLVAGISFNLLLLGYFKYSNFIVENVRSAFGIEATLDRIVLPIGISFYTFQKIALLVDSYRGAVRRLAPGPYALFVTFFPQLIAGPIVHHSEVVPQFEAAHAGPVWDRLAIGSTLFVAGLFEKVVLADTAALASDAVFAAAAHGTVPGLADSWIGALSYALQIYFDFSGYSNMAIGLAWLFGIRLPINFASPYRAVSIADFWKRWHITLSRFLRDYLYIPLGGNRCGRLRQRANLVLTMLLGGAWHGAGWNFLLWGALHGAFLVAHRTWTEHAPRLRAGGSPWPSRLLTFLCVVVAWVPFRAPDLASAARLYAGLLGMKGSILSASLLRSPIESALWIGILLSMAWFAPDLHAWMGAHGPGLPTPGYPNAFDDAGAGAPPRGMRWRPSRIAAVAVGVALFVCVVKMNDTSPFLYFQF